MLMKKPSNLVETKEKKTDFSRLIKILKTLVDKIERKQGENQF